MFTICINIIRELLDFTDLYSFNHIVGGKREKNHLTLSVITLSNREGFGLYHIKNCYLL